MAPKRANSDSQGSEYNPEVSSSDERTPTPSLNPSPSKREPRIKTMPKRYKYGVDRGVLGLAHTLAPQTQPPVQPQSKPTPPPQRKRGTVTIQEPSDVPVKKPVDPDEARAKGKQKVVEEPVLKRSKKGRHTPSRQSTPHSPTSRPPVRDEFKVVDNALLDITDRLAAPEGFLTALTRSDQETLKSKNFKDQFGHKKFCSVIAVDLERLKTVNNCDLSPYLGQFAPLLKISASYSPNLVKLVYYNMCYSNVVEDDEITEHGITTRFRGRTIRITSDLINKVLKITNAPKPEYKRYSNREIWNLLRPGQEFPPSQEMRLTFRPTSMPALQRVVWYVISHNLLQKGDSYSHFAADDYSLFAHIMDRKPIDVGLWMYTQIAKFRFHSRISSYVPFASLISVIMYYHRIWHLSDTQDQIVTLKFFGHQQLTQMKISFEEGEAQSMAQSRPGPSQASPSHIPTTEIPSQAADEEVHSQATSIPVDFEAKVKEIVQKAFLALSQTLDSEFQKLSAHFQASQQELLDGQSDLTAGLGTALATTGSLLNRMDATDSKLAAIDFKLDKLIQSRFTAAFGSEMDYSAGHGHSQPSPDIDFTPVAHSTVQTPTTEVVATAEQTRTPVVPITIDPLVSPDVPPTVKLATPLDSDSSFEDDKGGEI